MNKKVIFHIREEIHIHFLQKRRIAKMSEIQKEIKARIFNICQQDEFLTEEQIENLLAHKTIVRWAWVHHTRDNYTHMDYAKFKERFPDKEPTWKIGEHKTDHYHIVLQCTQLVSLNTIAKWLGIAPQYIEIPKGRGADKFLDCVEYLTHEDEKQQEAGKELYRDDEVHSNFDFRAILDQRKNNKIKYGRDLSDEERMKYDVLYNGKTLRQCMEEDRFIYMSIFEKLQKMRLQYIAMQTPPTTRINYYVSGDGGIGKGMMCRALARSMFGYLGEDEAIFFEVGAKGVPFEGYDGQPVIIWNDRRAYDLLQELNGRGNVFNVFDTHPTKQKQNVKYSSVNLCNQVNIVNSVQPFNEFLDGLVGEYEKKDGTKEKSEKSQKSQSYRRFPMIIEINESSFDLLINKGFFNNTREFEEYIEYRGIRGNMQRIAERCGSHLELQRKLESQAVQPITDKYHEVMAKFEESEIDEEAIMKEFEEYGTIRTTPIVLANGIQMTRERLSYLIDKGRLGTLTDEEKEELASLTK